MATTSQSTAKTDHKYAEGNDHAAQHAEGVRTETDVFCIGIGNQVANKKRNNSMNLCSASMLPRTGAFAGQRFWHGLSMLSKAGR